jgi:hypothetical protein
VNAGGFHAANAPPRLVKWQEFTDICENLSKINEQINTCTKPPSLVDTPFCIQVREQNLRKHAPGIVEVAPLCS